MTERTYRIVIGDLPPASDRRELLELILAAASLNLRLQVMLLGSAQELLTRSEDSAWRQLLDHDLAEVLIDRSGDDADDLPAGARPLDVGSLPPLPADGMVMRT